jgi:hypothetical protein
VAATIVALTVEIVATTTLIFVAVFIWKHRKVLKDIATNIKLLNHNLPSLADAVTERTRQAGTLRNDEEDAIEG